MDDDRFDAAVRSLVAGPSRRAFVGRAAAALMAGAGVVIPAAEGSARKKRCRGCSVCKECVRGRCRPLPATTPCGGSCKECQSGKCVNKLDNTDCGFNQKCLMGVCKSQPNCVSAGVGGCASPVFQCCSDSCDLSDPEYPGGICAKGANGSPCKVNNDCPNGSSCVGYVCQ